MLKRSFPSPVIFVGLLGSMLLSGYTLQAQARSLDEEIKAIEQQIQQQEQEQAKQNAGSEEKKILLRSLPVSLSPEVINSISKSPLFAGRPAQAKNIRVTYHYQETQNLDKTVEEGEITITPLGHGLAKAMKTIIAGSKGVTGPEYGSVEYGMQRSELSESYLLPFLMLGSLSKHSFMDNSCEKIAVDSCLTPRLLAPTGASESSLTRFESSGSIFPLQTGNSFTLVYDINYNATNFKSRSNNKIICVVTDKFPASTLNPVFSGKAYEIKCSTVYKDLDKEEAPTKSTVETIYLEDYGVDTFLLTQFRASDSKFIFPVPGKGEDWTCNMCDSGMREPVERVYDKYEITVY